MLQLSSFNQRLVCHFPAKSIEKVVGWSLAGLSLYGIYLLFNAKLHFMRYLFGTKLDFPRPRPIAIFQTFLPLLQLCHIQ